MNLSTQARLLSFSVAIFTLSISACDQRENDQTPEPSAEVAAMPASSEVQVEELETGEIPMPELNPDEKPASPKSVNLRSLELDELTERYLDPVTAKPFEGAGYNTQPNGKIASEGTLVDGYMDGVWMEYHENGKKASQGTFKRGMENGRWEFWWENGNLITEGEFVNASPSGLWKSYDDQGRLEAQGHFVNGLMDGVWEYFNPETSAVTQFTFKEGKRITAP